MGVGLEARLAEDGTGLEPDLVGVILLPRVADELSRLDEEDGVGDVAHRDHVLAVAELALLHGLRQRGALGVCERREDLDRLEEVLGLGRVARAGAHHDVAECLALERPEDAAILALDRRGAGRVVKERELAEGLARLEGRLDGVARGVEEDLVLPLVDEVEVVAVLALRDDDVILLADDLDHRRDHDGLLLVRHPGEQVVLVDAVHDPQRLRGRLVARGRNEVLLAHRLLRLSADSDAAHGLRDAAPSRVSHLSAKLGLHILGLRRVL
mmetsp:Transcript_48017/g.115372  ORF Transcript_48017/g.115372 Transcript_48017/m.115372 type:complete len:269 (+) Transcript_48017:1822-2628(+)